VANAFVADLLPVNDKIAGAAKDELLAVGGRTAIAKKLRAYWSYLGA
jgi:hypothetical protein